MNSRMSTYGWHIIKKPYANELLGEIESCFRKMAFRDDGVGVRIGESMEIPHLHQIVFNEELVEFLRTILVGRPCIFPNVTVRRNSQTPWHVDEAFRSNAVQWSDNQSHEFVQITTYFQVNDENGGGLQVIPASHRISPDSKRDESVIDVVRNLLKSAQTIQSVLGDIVIWDGRLLHRSTPRKQTSRVNYAIHWTVASENADLEGFLRHIIARGRNTDDPFGVDRRYDEVAKFRFTSDAPMNFLKSARKQGVRLVDMGDF